MEFLSILQDFVPYRRPATLCDFTISKKQGRGTANLLMPFCDLFYNSLLLCLSLFLSFNSLPLSVSLRLFLGSGPNRGQSPVEWGEIPSVRTSVRPYVRTSPPGLLAGSQALLVPSQNPLAGPQIPLACLQTLLVLRPLWQAFGPLWQTLRPL